MAAYCPHCMFPTDTPYCPNCGQSTSWQPGEGQLHAGTVLNGSGLHRYITGAAIGQGGFGITYIAVDMDSGERVAVKECFPTQCAQRGVNGVAVEARSGFEQTLQGALESFLEEARLLARQGALASIVQVRDFFRANGTAYLVMEYLDGVTLKNMMCTGGVIPAQELLRRLRPLIGDLGRLHASGVIHRDISPDNLMWMPSGGIKLLDFGCARSMENGKSMSVQLKHGFAPVEQYQTRGQGPWTDIYALCATIYYCTTGRLPTPAVERLEGGELTAPTALGSDLTPRQEAALLWGMEVQPARRPQAMEDLAAALYAGPAEDGGREGGRRREKTGGNGYTPPGEEKKRDVRSGGLPARTRRIAAIAPAALRHEFLECRAVHVLHDDIDGIVGLEKVAHGDDLRLFVHFCHRPRLIEEAPAALVVVPLRARVAVHLLRDVRVARDPGGGEIFLYGDLQLQLQVAADIGDAEAALPQHAAHEIAVHEHGAGRQVVRHGHIRARGEAAAGAGALLAEEAHAVWAVFIPPVHTPRLPSLRHMFSLYLFLRTCSSAFTRRWRCSRYNTCRPRRQTWPRRRRRSSR